MAKLNSESKFDSESNVLSFTCTDSESGEGFTREVNITTVFGAASAIGRTALAFAARTALRNATGGREIDEAEEAVDARMAAWARGEWGVERASGGENAPFTAGNILAKAVARVYGARFATAADAAAALSEMLASQLALQKDPTTWDALSEEDQRKARNAFTKNARSKDSAVDAAIAAIQAEQAATRNAKKQAAVKGEGAGLFG